MIIRARARALEDNRNTIKNLDATYVRFDERLPRLYSHPDGCDSSREAHPPGRVAHPPSGRERGPPGGAWAASPAGAIFGTEPEKGRVGVEGFKEEL
jgi:hypothetical protein